VRAIGYFREMPSRSLAEQSEEFLAFCTKNGYEAVAAFLDAKADESSPGFRQLLDFVRQQQSSGFLVIVLNRLGALGDGALETARRYFQLASLGVRVIAVDTGDEVARLLMDLWLEYRANGTLSEKVRTAMRTRAVKGEALGRPPYGYRVGPRRRLVVVTEEGSVVRYIFRLYLKDGLGIRRIARRLNEDGLRTRRQGLWSMVTVRDILRNRAYVGTYSRFGVRVPASHAPLISQEDFQVVQQRLDQRRPTGGSRHVSPFLLSGLAYCGYCGNKMIGVTRKQRWKRRSDGEVRTAQYRYYQCESRTNRSLCDYHTRRAEELDDEVRTAISAGAGTPLIHRPGNGASAAAHNEQEARRLRQKARRLDRRLEQCLDAAATGAMNQEKLLSTGLVLATEHLELEEHLALSNRVTQEQLSEGERRKHQAALVQSLKRDWDALPLHRRQELLREIIARVVIKDDAIETVLRP